MVTFLDDDDLVRSGRRLTAYLARIHETIDFLNSISSLLYLAGVANLASRIRIYIADEKVQM